MDTLRFSQGTLLLTPEPPEALAPCFTFDNRTKEWRAPAYAYREIVLLYRQENLPLQDEAKAYASLALTLQRPIVPRPHQADALAAWQKARNHGVVSLPTGAGKTILAVLAIASVQRSTLVVVPTLDLVQQWRTVLGDFFGEEIGVLGGGEKKIAPLTVATYDTAKLMIERMGNQFGFLIVDECHHLPAPFYQLIALASLAPFRLGLSATLERSDGGETRLFELMGDLVYEAHIGDMVNQVLAPYEVIQIPVSLDAEERATYEASRGVYLQFLRRNGIQMGTPEGWRQFLFRASRNPEGKAAFKAYREQKRIAQAARGKLDEIWNLLQLHSTESILIFTDDNAMAYEIGCELFLPVLTHKTKAAERKRMLDAFRSGEITVITTSKVLNEGVDVPQAQVGIVVSGSGVIREHVQRLGRILRHQPGKRAVLYEIVSHNTNEQSVNQRRRQHDAYQRSSSI
jgi:superfamily II DNA or RNA helicase